MRNINTASRYSLYAADGRLMFTNDARRAMKSYFIYLGQTLVAISEQPTSGGTTTVKYQHTDTQGTPIAETNAARVITQTSEYEPYGRLANRALTDAPGYTGHLQDAASGLTYMQQRYYDPAIGRFLSVDPVTANATTGANFNRYWYANNNPFKFSDPDGRCAKLIGKRICREDTVKIVIGFRGAQLGDQGGDNQTFVPFIKNALTGSVYAHGPRGRSEATKAILDFKKENPDGEIHLLGYSRGGRAAVQVANNLGKMGVKVATLTTFDPHDVNNSDLPLQSGNVGSAQNYFQRNPATSPFGENPFRGRPVTEHGINVSGKNYTGDLGINHINIVQEALFRNRSEILGE